MYEGFTLTRLTHSPDVMAPVRGVWNAILHWTPLCVILCMCHVRTAQPCLTNPSDGNGTCTVRFNCTEEGLPELPKFPDVRLWQINDTRLIELVEPCLPEIITTTTTEEPSTVETTSSVTGTDIATVTNTVKDSTTPTETTTPGNTQSTPPPTTELDATSAMSNFATSTATLTYGNTQSTSPPPTEISSTSVTSTTRQPITSMVSARSQNPTTEVVASMSAASPTNAPSTPETGSLGNGVTEQPTLESTVNLSTLTDTGKTTSGVEGNITTPTTPDESGTNVWIIVLGVSGGLLGVGTTSGLAYYFVRKKNETCKVHCSSDKEKPADKPAVPATQVPGPNSPNQQTATTSPTGGQATVQDPIENMESRARAFSTGSQAGDTAILMPANTEGTSQAWEPKKKTKKEKTKRGAKATELESIKDPEPAEYDQVMTTEKVV